jgi:hypothetical protein
MRDQPNGTDGDEFLVSFRLKDEICGRIVASYV